jgi:hypothetical protein
MLSGKASQPFHKLLETKEQAMVRAQKMAARMEEAEAALNAVYASRSWRITPHPCAGCFSRRGYYTIVDDAHMRRLSGKSWVKKYPEWWHHMITCMLAHFFL